MTVDRTDDIAPLLSADLAVRLAHAVWLREHDETAAACNEMQALVADYPDNALVQYQAAWALDKLGREREAVPHYEKAIEFGLAGDDLRGALLGLGSTYRTLGEYERAADMLEYGRQTFPDAPEFAVFLAMVRYNQGRAADVLPDLLALLAEVLGDPAKAAALAPYRRAIAEYAPQLDRIWD